MADLYAVPCPNCSAHIGEPCRYRGAYLSFAHLTRRRLAQRRSEALAQRDRRRSLQLARPRTA